MKMLKSGESCGKMRWVLSNLKEKKVNGISSGENVPS